MPKNSVSLNQKGFTPLESPAIYGGDDTYKISLSHGKGEVKAPSFLTGFTIIELLVVMFIVSLISGSVLAGYWSGQKQNSVSRASQQLAADLRRAQNMAISGVVNPTGCASNCAKGYGLYTSSVTQYILFYNTGTSKTRGGGSTDLETITLSGGVSLSPTGQNVYFTPPDPTTYINGANSGSQTFTISSGNFSKTVTVYASGRIDVQ